MPPNTGTRPRRQNAPRRASFFYRHFQDHDGNPGLSVWCGLCSLPPLFSFQVYITYDLSEAEKSDLEALAKRLLNKLLDPSIGVFMIRLDVHILGPGATTEDCVASFRRAKQAPSDDPSMHIVPSYVASDYHYYHCFFFKVSSPDWERNETGLTSVSFEPACPDDVTDDRAFVEEAMSIDEAQEGTSYLYGCSSFKEDCKAVYEAAQAAGLTEW
ncbi:uncharacterized protein BKA78DRAFT_355195 [Phyllosticta capitalensis]|uniref:uncharacterized protein n=1 Tax=Phyllosticta capitalensis TaxID=121624 RepID=UPI00312F4104